MYYTHLAVVVLSVSSWGDSILDHSDDEDRLKSVLSLSPVDLRRKESHRSATDGGLSTPGLSRNDSSFSKLSRHDSTHSNQSFLSTPPYLSRNTSLKLLPNEVSGPVTNIECFHFSKIKIIIIIVIIIYLIKTV